MRKGGKNIQFNSCQNDKDTISLQHRWIFASDETIRPLLDARNALMLYNRKELIEGMRLLKTAPTIDVDKARQFHFVFLSENY